LQQNGFLVEEVPTSFQGQKNGGMIKARKSGPPSITEFVMKLITALALAALLSTPFYAAAAARVSPPHGSPNIPTNPVDRSPGGNKFTPEQLKSGVYSKPTPVPILRKISVPTDLEMSIQAGDSKFMLHIVSSLPIRNLTATNKDSGLELASVKLDDAVDFTVEVDGQPNTAVAVALDFNTGFFKGKQRIRTTVFDLLGPDSPAAAPDQATAVSGTAKGPDDFDLLPAELKNAPEPE
jgi:hypothetical protein